MSADREPDSDEDYDGQRELVFIYCGRQCCFRHFAWSWRIRLGSINVRGLGRPDERQLMLFPDGPQA